MKKIIIFGSDGMLGNYIKRYFIHKSFLLVIPLNRYNYDIIKQDYQDLEKVLLENNINHETVVFNAIGVIPQASKNYELNNDLYTKVNKQFPIELSRLCNKYGAQLIHPTTDCVYSGKTGNYFEDSVHDANDIYGSSKSLGEPSDCTVIRTSIIGEEKYNKRSLLEWVKSNKNGKINGYANHFWNGITCLQFAKIVELIIDQNLYWKGVRHIFSPDSISKYNLVKLINEIYNLNIEINEYNTPEPCNKCINTKFEINQLLNIPPLEQQIKELYKWNTIDQPPRVYDCFNFYNEIEILHLRLDYLYDSVDKFIIVESLDSHSKKVRKEKYIFEDNIDKYKQYIDKIVYLKIDSLPYDNPWENENYQKNYCVNGLKEIHDDDWILFSDVDEIPNKNIIRNLDVHTDKNMLRFEQKLFYYHVNVLQNQIWSGTVAVQKRRFVSMMNLRNHRGNLSVYAFKNGGWHYSYMGGPEKVYQKMKSYAESTDNNHYCNIKNITKSIETSKDILGRTEEVFIKKEINIYDHGMSPSNISNLISIYPHLLKKKVNISYVCLIYKSVEWLKFVYSQVQKYTDLSENEFFFVANDANTSVLNYLSANNIPHYVHNNTEEQRKEWYINNVYRAYNYGAKMALGQYVIFLNSDMAFAPRWSEKLLESITENTCVASRLVERGYLRSGMYGIEKNFGHHYNDYRENDFLNYANSIQEKSIKDGGLYMPLLIKKEHLEKVGYYPEGNIAPGCDIFNPVYAKIGEHCIPGDRILMDKLKSIGISHKTNFESIIYHFQQGEMSS